jgi:hypothetical protein
VIFHVFASTSTISLALLQEIRPALQLLQQIGQMARLQHPLNLPLQFTRGFRRRQFFQPRNMKLIMSEKGHGRKETRRREGDCPADLGVLAVDSRQSIQLL